MAVCGLFLTVELAFVYYQANYNPYARPSFCAINDFADCDFVAQTSKAVFLGVPLAYWGMFFYIFVLVLLYFDKLQKIKGLGILKVFRNPYSYITVLGLVSFLISMTLAFISIFSLQRICVLCFVTYFINLALGVISAKISGYKQSFKDSFFDFISGVKEYPIQFVMVLIFAGIFLSYATIAMPFASKKQSIKHYIKMKHNPYSVSGNVLGNPEGKKKIHIYSDFVCPICSSYNIMLHRIVRSNKELYVIHHNLPLDTECNPYLERQMHKGACRMARYVIAAENQGKYWDMASLLFEHRPKNDTEAVNLALTLNLDIEKFIRDINSKETRSKLALEIDDAIGTGVDGTPTLKVGDKYYCGAKPYYELKRIVLGD